MQNNTILATNQITKLVSEQANLENDAISCVFSCKKKDCCKKFKKGKRCKSCPND